LNIWRVIGYLFLGFGFVFLALDAIAGYSVAYTDSYFAAVSPQTTLHLLVDALTPYATIASFMFVIAAVGLYAARTSYIVNVDSPSLSFSSSHKTSSQPPASSTFQGYPPPQVSICPKCKQTIVLVKEYQKWYCLNEKKYL